MAQEEVKTWLRTRLREYQQNLARNPAHKSNAPRMTLQIVRHPIGHTSQNFGHAATTTNSAPAVTAETRPRRSRRRRGSGTEA